jgi:hypothetical protein
MHEETGIEIERQAEKQNTGKINPMPHFSFV